MLKPPRSIASPLLLTRAANSKSLPQPGWGSLPVDSATGAFQPDRGARPYSHRTRTGELTPLYAAPQRLVRFAGCAALVWGVFQLLATKKPSFEYWAGAVAINVLPTLILGWCTLRRNVLAAGALGVYGLYRIVIGARMIGMAFDLAAERPTDWWVAPLAIPFAIAWIVGAFAAVRLHQRRGAATPP